jgi:hypothetical protein
MTPITNVALCEHRTIRAYHSAYKLRTDKPHVWLQRVCCWVLNKLGAHHFEEDISYTVHGVNADTFMERIFKSQHLVHEFVGRPGAVLLIGAEDYRYLMASPEIRSSFSFTGQYRASRGGGMPRLFGLRVHVLPYLRGLAVLPEGL